MPAFTANLVLAALLFERTIQISQPDNWQAIRLEVNKRDIDVAVQAYVNRFSLQETDANYPAMDFPHSIEGSASEAIQSLLDDGREAMIERRQGDFNRILASIEGTLAHAMDELSAAGFKWSPPGAQPLWPPLRELNTNLNSFREDVIRAQDREFLPRLLSFDYWILRESIQRRCGELFTVAIANDRQNYEIANRMDGGDLMKLLRGRIWMNAPHLLSNVISEEEYPYFKQLVDHQERLLDSAMRVDSPTEYQRLHEGFEEFFRATGIHMGHSRRYDPVANEQIVRLGQDYRIALMGLGGRAALLAKSGVIADPTPYLEVVRGKHNRVESLADDIAMAMTIANDDSKGFTLWDEWDMEQGKSYEAYLSYPARFPLSWFAIRLIELSSEPQRALNLQGKAKEIHDWFERNSEGLETAVQDAPEQSVEERRELATAALTTALHTDEVARDHAIIARNLSPARLLAFKSSVQETASTTDHVGKLFEQAGALTHLPLGADGGPETINLTGWGPKEFLAEWPKDYPTEFVPLDGSPYGRAYSSNMVKLLGEALKGAPHITSSIDTPRELLEAIDTASANLNAVGELVVVLMGNWDDIVIGLNVENLDGYEPMWRARVEDQIGDVGLHLGNPIVSTFTRDKRHLYVIDVATWGHLVKAQVEPENDVDLKVNPVSAAMARGYLDMNPSLYAAQPDDKSKLRKLQTLVEIVISHRSEFRVSDPSRACRISDDIDRD